MNNRLTTDVGQMMEDLAALLPPESRAMFLAACQNLARLPLPANRDLATVFIGAAWTITQRGGLKALPEITRKMEKVIKKTVENTIEHSVKRTVKETVRGLEKTPRTGIFTPVPKQLVTAIHDGPKDALYLEIAARVKVACETELQQCLDRIKQEQASLAKCNKVQRWVIGLLAVFLLASFVGSLGIARHAAEAKGFAEGKKNFAEDMGIQEDAIEVIQEKDAQQLLSDPELKGIRQVLLDKNVLPALLDPEFQKVLSAQAHAPSAQEKRELTDGYKMIIRCRQLGVHLYLADPAKYAEYLPPDSFALGIHRALIKPETISQNGAENFTLIPFKPAEVPR
jgi:hypothetical protein